MRRRRFVTIPCAVAVTLTTEQFGTIRSRDDLEQALRECVLDLTSGGEHPVDVSVEIRDWEQLREGEGTAP